MKKCDRACRHADTPASTCTCVCKGRHHGIYHRQGLTDLFAPLNKGGQGGSFHVIASEAKQSHPCIHVKLNPKAA